MQIQEDSKMIFGSFPFRGTMQSARLICEYIGVQYQNVFFNPLQWQKYKQTQAKDWLYKQIPFLKCNNIIITNGYAAAEFIAEKYQRYDLLGVTPEQKIFMYSALSFYTIILGALSLQCQIRQGTQQQKTLKRQKYWKQSCYPKFQKVNNLCHGQWFFSHLTILDFFIYEDYLLFSNIYPEMKNLKNLQNVYQNISNIPIIKKFETERAIKQKCPNHYFRQFKQQLKKYKTINQNQDINENKCQNKQSQQKINTYNKTGFCPYKKDDDKKMNDQ